MKAADLCGFLSRLLSKDLAGSGQLISRLLRLLLRLTAQLTANPEVALDLVEVATSAQLQYSQSCRQLTTLVRAHCLNAMLLQVGGRGGGG